MAPSTWLQLDAHVLEHSHFHSSLTTSRLRSRHSSSVLRQERDALVTHLAAAPSAPGWVQGRSSGQRRSTDGPMP